MNRKSRFPLMVTAVALAVGAVAWYVTPSQPDPSPEGTARGSKTSLAPGPASAPSLASVPVSSPDIEPRLPPPTLKDETEFANQQGPQLYNERGLDSQQRAIYSDYPLEALQQMSANNDAYATLALANKLAMRAPFTEAELQEMDHSQVHRAFIKQEHQTLSLKKFAAAQGSVEAINEIFYQMYGQHYAFGESTESDNPELLRELYGLEDPAMPIEWELHMNAAAWAVVHGRRGDPIRSLINLEILDKRFALNRNNWSEVLNRAEAIYAALAAQRKALGLAPFNNKVVEEYGGEYTVRQNDYYAWLLSQDTLPSSLDYFSDSVSHR
ncbi:hypothetical protein [Gilvimarinus xylanilyticus]|uniref:DUF4375 domain-containing protein n=1 Tax=Gilvimarinus xylanilyticus TaxID=2944139 RepID=A0A9X2KX24_9GAMM|nr:hypothetical protein [Gilvimarinus xylanilyticus]MCP8900405.1 hypothetical protein [Gilvimarinus xylanilyticus]